MERRLKLIVVFPITTNVVVIYPFNVVHKAKKKSSTIQLNIHNQVDYNLYFHYKKNNFYGLFDSLCFFARIFNKCTNVLGKACDPTTLCKYWSFRHHDRKCYLLKSCCRKDGDKAYQSGDNKCPVA